MKNKFKFFIFYKIIILLIFMTNANSVEQFNFDITEVQILENGNKFKGLKRGTATGKDGLKILANFFEYDKKTEILNAFGEVEIIDKANDFLLFAENITYYKKQEKIITKGNTKAIIESKYNLVSKDVTLLRNKKELFSSKNIEIKDDKLNLYKLDNYIYYLESSLIKGNNIEIISNYKKNPGERDLYLAQDGIFDLKSKNFNSRNTKVYLKKDSFNEIKNDPRIYGVSSNKSGDITTVNKGIFTSCGLNHKCPPWSIKAKKIQHDQSKKKLTYNNAFINVYDIPVMYFPKFFHPDPSVKRQSGLLTPQINSSDILGSSLIIPYFHVISENKDLTFTPTIFDSNIYMFQNEFRQKNKFSEFIADVGHVRGYKSTASNKKNSISHFFGKFNLDLNLKDYNNSKLNLNIEKISNDTYLKVFDTNLIDKEIKPLNQNNISSNVNLELDKNAYTLAAGISVYENLNSTNNDKYQFVFPYYNFTKNLLSNKLVNLNFLSSGYNDLRDTNVARTTLTNDLQILSKNFFTNSGLQNNFGIYFKNLNTLGKNYSNYKSSPQSEITSIYNFESSIPLVKYENNYNKYLTPKVSIRTNPGDMKDYSNSDRKIFANNIFSIDRLGIGNDSFEKGTSLTAGVNYTKEKIGDINKYFSFDLATVLRDKNENQIPVSSTIGNTSSNLIGSSTFSLSENYKIDYNFSLDNNFNNFEYNNLIATYSFKNFMTKFSFIEENKKLGATNSLENTTEFKFDEDKYLYFNTRRNRETNLTEYYDLIYEYKNDCLVANIKYKKTYYQDRELTPSEDLLFSVTLFPLSTFEQKVNQNLYRN